MASPAGAQLCDALLFRADHRLSARLLDERQQRLQPGSGIGLGDFKRGRQRATPAAGALSTFLDATPGLRRRVVLMLGSLLLVNVVLIVTTLAVSARYPALISPAILAYTFGLRHAVDADHLAAIDNMTRRLMSDGQRPVTVGLYFSLGHSTIVFILSILVAVATSWLKGNVTRFQTYGTIIGTSISAVFLIIIGLVNLWVLKGLLRRRSEMRAAAAAPSSPLGLKWSPRSGHRRLERPEDGGEEESQRSLGADEAPPADAHSPAVQTERDDAVEAQRLREEAEANEAKIGFMNNCCPCVSRMVDTPWKMYPVGVLFGLGFDTATEVALLAISAAAPGQGIPIYLILLLPSLFTAAMAMIDTLDGILMLWAYGWAFVDPNRKLGYNIFVTLTSALIALVIAGVESLAVLASAMQWKGPFWQTMINAPFEILGYLIIGLFVIGLTVSIVVMHCNKRQQSTTAPTPQHPPDTSSGSSNSDATRAEESTGARLVR